MICLRKCLYNPMVCNGNGRMSPLISTFHQRFGIRNPIHIAHLCMTVKLYSFLWAGIYSGSCKIGNFLNPGYGCNSQFTVKTVYCCHTAKLQKSPLLYMFCHFRHLFISQKHFYYNTVCKVRDREDQDSLFITDFSCLYIHNLTPDNDLTHFTGNCFQCNRFAFEISSIDNIWVTVSSETASEIAFLVPAVDKGCFLIFLLLLRSLSLLFCFFIIASGIFGLISFLTFCIHFRMTDYIFNFLCDLDCCILTIFTFLSFCKFQFYF